MCKVVTVINELRLGNRLLGYECWSGRNVVEFTENQLKNIIREGKQRVCGLKLGKSGMLELDNEGFYTTNMTVHNHINNWVTVEESVSNVLFVCVGSSVEGGKTAAGEGIEVARLLFPNDNQVNDNVETVNSIIVALRKRIRKSV